MNVALGAAGIICVAMALGHATIGLVWVLPNLAEDRLSSTPFGPSSMTRSMIRVTWHIVTIFVLAVGGLLMTLAWGSDADPKTLLLRWFAAMWLVAAAMAAWTIRRRPRQLLRLPVPVLWVVVAALCWGAST